jgi:hypothetical protein
MHTYIYNKHIFSFLIRIGEGGGEVHTGFNRHVSHFWPIVPAPGDCEDGEFGEMKICRGNRSTWEKPTPAPLCPSQIPLGQTRVWSWAAAVGSQPLTAWAVARPNNHIPKTLTAQQNIMGYVWKEETGQENGWRRNSFLISLSHWLQSNHIKTNAILTLYEGRCFRSRMYTHFDASYVNLKEFACCSNINLHRIWNGWLLCLVLLHLTAESTEAMNVWRMNALGPLQAVFSSCLFLLPRIFCAEFLTMRRDRRTDVSISYILQMYLRFWRCTITHDCRCSQITANAITIWSSIHKLWLMSWNCWL